MLNNITIGADPELFIVDTAKNKVISSIGMIPGKKGEPYTKGMPKGFGLETDNILAEFNIPPCRTREEFLYSINYMKSYIRRFVRRVNPDYSIMCTASAIVTEDQLQSDEAKEFGCMPDFNAYTKDVNPRPEGEKTNLRSAGCHIHIGYDDPNPEDSIKLIKYMDMFLGAPSVAVDTDKRRRSLYGKAGCFRLTEYGCEYRVLSSYFISNDNLIDWMWEGIMLAIDAFNNDLPLYDKTKIIEAVNTSNPKLIQDLIR